MSISKRKEIKILIKKLNEASKAYYKENKEIMSNFEYDRMYDELEKLEKETGIIMAGSPTLNVGYEVLEYLPKETHQSRMLSLDKTKSLAELKEWLADKEGILSWKLDGLTVVITYENGNMVKAVTRGNGEVGEVVTSNAKVFANLPVSIPFKGNLTVRGEAYITYSDFEKINKKIPDIDAKYKNPRNLCSGSVRQLNSEITAERNVRFSAFSLTSAINPDGSEAEFENSFGKQLKWLQSQGFEIVENYKVTKENIEEYIGKFEKNIETMDIPSDGLVLVLDDIEYGISLGNTAKFPRNAIAFKWKDEIAETILREIEWSPSRTGLINPVAIFEPVQLEGTTVSRASVHNVSILKELKLGIGDKIKVYKANMIIPQIAENLTRSGNVEIPTNCPVCGGNTEIKSDGEVETLVCTNKDCPVKKIKAFSLFVSRDAMNIENVSEATLEKFIEKGFIKDFADLFKLENYKEDIVNLDGFGIKSYENIIASVKKSSKTTVAKLLYALGISGIGVANAKLIAKAVGNDWNNVVSMTFEQLIAIDGIGDIMANAFLEYFDDEKNKKIVDDIIKYVEFENEKTSSRLEGITFVITGSVEKFKNRNHLKEVIEKENGKVATSVSKNTDYLINNDILSNSSKNKKAKELGIDILTEDMFVEKFEIEI